MELPGGLLRDGKLRRDYVFKPITGEIERAVAESHIGTKSLAEQVTSILANVLENIAGFPADKQLVRRLCGGDRHYLMQQIATIFDPNSRWLTVPCESCEELIQFQLAPAELPVKPAGDGYPQTQLSLTSGTVAVRVPTGEDEEILARESSDEPSAMRLLLKQLLSAKDTVVDTNALTVQDQELIDQVLDDMAPQLSESVNIGCPYCDEQQVVRVDNYDWITRETAWIDDEIHILALHYHWSEKEILSLSRLRRQHYIQLIERSLGKHQGEDFVQYIEAEGA